MSVNCLAQLPQESIIDIFRFTDLKTLVRMASVCKLFAQIQEDNALWCVEALGPKEHEIPGSQLPLMRAAPRAFNRSSNGCFSFFRLLVIESKRDFSWMTSLIQARFIRALKGSVFSRKKDKIPQTVLIEPGCSMKERVVRYYDQVLLGKEWEDSQTFHRFRSQVRCRLSIPQKIISALGYEFFDLCLLAMKHDRVRNGSFLVCVKSYVSPYKGEGFADPCVLIKDKEGSVVTILDLEDHLHEVYPTGYPNSSPELRQAFFDELCKYQSKETPYHEYRLDFTELAQDTKISPVKRAQLDQALEKIKKIEQDTKKLLNGE